MSFFDNTNQTTPEITRKTINWGTMQSFSNYEDEQHLRDAMARRLPQFDLYDKKAKPQETAAVEPQVRFEMGPEEEPDGSYRACPPWRLLSAWAAGQEVDDDFALLVFAITAGHVAGPRLHFEGLRFAPDISIPTVISTAGDTKFHNAVIAATQSLLPIQQDLVAKYGELTSAPAPKKPRKSAFESFRDSLTKSYEKFRSGYKNPAKDMNPDKQRNGPVLFVLEGALPAKPYKTLKKCHLYSALLVGGTQELPRLGKSRETRIREIRASIYGHLNGDVWIRGFMRFSEEDLEWLVGNRRHVMYATLPVESSGDCKPVPLESAVAEAQEFDRLHRMALRRILELRFSRADCNADFCSEEAACLFQRLRKRYRFEAGAVSYMDLSSAILPDLLSWYLLQLNRSGWIDIDEIEIAEHAIAVSRRLRRRVAAFYDRHTAVQLARKRMALATMIVARMKRRQGPCKRRDIARGLDNQRMEVIDPVIGKLVALGVVAEGFRKCLTLEDKEPRALQVDDFMEPIQDVPYSLLCRLAVVEAYQPDVENPDEPQD